MPPQSRGDLEQRLAAVEAALGTGPGTGAVGPRPAPTTSRGIRDVVLRAAADPDFATELLANPELIGAENGLAPEQVEKIRLLSGQGLLNSVLETRGIIQARPIAEGGGGGGYY